MAENFATVFDRAALLDRVMGDADLAALVVSTFLDDMPRQLLILAKALEVDDIEAAGDQAHRIKGAAASVGGEAMSAVAAVIESAARSRDLAAVKTLRPRLDEQFAHLKAAVAADLQPAA
jgi:HPt (histidine-containing phosphotransfer) domain-containing protein